MILAYFQSSRGLEVASKSPVLCNVSQVSEWSLGNQKGLFCVAFHASEEILLCFEVLFIGFSTSVETQA